MRRNFCQACSFARFGVKTRIAIPHTCGANKTFRTFDLMENVAMTVQNNFLQVDCDGAHEYIEVKVSSTASTSTLVSHWQCRHCGRVLEDSSVGKAPSLPLGDWIIGL
jgi:hypothetical protein